MTEILANKDMKWQKSCLQKNPAVSAKSTRISGSFKRDFKFPTISHSVGKCWEVSRILLASFIHLSWLFLIRSMANAVCYHLELSGFVTNSSFLLVCHLVSSSSSSSILYLSFSVPNNSLASHLPSIDWNL
jgi:hypothetical protein